MNPASHLLLGWLVANLAAPGRRERALVTVAGIAPDIDGLGIVAERLTLGSEHPLLWWSEYHHVLAHNLGCGLLLAAVGLAWGRRRLRTAALMLLAFHLHLLADLVGARGPAGDQWPIPYLLPFSRVWELTWEHQWALNAWPNLLISAAALLLTLYLAWRRGFSLLELISDRADAALVRTLRARFGDPRPSRSRHVS